MFRCQVNLLEKLHWPLITHGETVITSHHDPLCPNLLDHVFHDWLRVGDRVVGKAFEITAGRLREMFQFLSCAPALVDAADQDGKYTAAVRQANLQLWMAVEHAAENQMAGGNRGVNGIA